MKPSKKEVEKAFVEDFLKKYMGQIPAQLIPGERPDFVLDQNNRKIGIEVTQIYRSPNDGNSSFQAQASWQKKAIDSLNLRYKTNYRIYVSFEEISNINGTNFDGLCDEIIKQIESALETGKPSWSRQIDIYKYKFDRGKESLFSVSIYEGIEGMSTGFHMLNVFSVDPLNLASLYGAIKKKNLLLPGYRKCDEIWLLCVIHFFDHAMDQSLPDRLEIGVPESNFDKIILYKTVEEIIRVVK